MAQIIDLGKLRFAFRGTYNSGTSYSINDVVKYGANLYAYTATTAATGQLPTNTSYWTNMLEGFDYLGEYNPGTAYKLNDVVTYGGKLFIAIKANTNVNPNATVTPPDTPSWEILTDGIKYRGSYSGGTAYTIGEIVIYGGILYIATANTTGNAPTNTSFWATFLEGIKYLGAYSGSTTYRKNEVVTYDGSTWICVLDTLGNAPADPSSFWDVLAPGTFPSFSGSNGYFLSNNGSSVIWTNDLVGDTAEVQNDFYVGSGAKEFALDENNNSEPLTNPVATFRFNSGTEDSSFAQLAFQNADATSSTDIITYMDNGSDSKGWMGIGIAGSEFDDTTYGITGPGDGYIFHETAGDPGDYTGNLVFATGANGSENKIVFAAGGFDSGLTQMEIFPDVNVHIEIPTPSTSPTTGALTVVGGVGVQGDMNIQGNVNIVGEITFGGEGTVVETSNLAVSDPTVFVGSNNLADTLDLGIIAEYAEDVTDQPTSVTNKQLTDNVATLTTSAAHGYSVGDVVVVTNVDSTFNGTFVITATPASNTFRYAKTAANVNSTAVSPAGTATVTHERRFGGVVRDASDGVVKVFSGSTARPSGTVDFSNAGLVYAPIKAGAGDFTSLTTGNITSTSGTINLGGTVNISSAANFTGANVTLGSGTWSGTPTFSGAVVFSGNPSFTGTPTFTGGVRVQEMIEDIVDVTHSGNTIALDYQNGNVFFLTNTLSTNATVNVSNAPSDDGRVFTINLFITQGSTGYIPATLNINGGSATIKWPENTAPTPTSGVGKIDVFNFTIIRRSGTYTVLGNVGLNY